MTKISAIILNALVFAHMSCKDPNEGKTKAVVNEAKEIPSTQMSAEASAKDEMISIETSSSSIEFVGSKVTGSHKGSFSTFTGTITLRNGKAETSFIKATIDLNSISTDNEKLTNHLKSKEFFETDKFPQATFLSTEIKIGSEGSATHTVTGNLDLHGVKKSISFPATIQLTADAITASAEFVINRKDFGINYPGKANDLIRDTVAIKFTLKGARKK